MKVLALAAFLLAGPQLSQFYTDLLSKDSSGIENVRLAAAKINNVVVRPNEIFSFNKYVGDSNQPKYGWNKSKIIYQGENTTGYGGGIYQVSSTLFNTVRYKNNKPYPIQIYAAIVKKQLHVTISKN